MTDPLTRPPIFVLSAPRAGSTLLSAILGTHSQVLCPPEPWLLLVLDAVWSQKTSVTSASDHALARQATHAIFDDKLYADAVAAFATTVYERMLRQAGKQVLADKTPRYYHILPLLEAAFPQSPKIWINRNPLDVIASCKQTWQLGIDELMGEPLSPHSFDTTISFAVLAQHFRSPGPLHYVVRYEDLVADPESHVRRLCDFLHLPYEPAMLNYGANQPLMGQLAATTMGDKKVLDHAAAHTRSVGRWTETLTRDELRRILLTLGSNLFRDGGYDQALADAATRAGLALADIAPDGALPQLLQQYQTYADTSAPQSAGAQYTQLSRHKEHLEQLLAACEADRAARLGIIQQQGRQIGELQGQCNDVQAQLRDMQQQFAHAEADRADRLKVIEDQGRRLGEIQGQRNDLHAQLQDVRHQFELSEADRAARLKVIEEQGRQLSELLAQHHDMQQRYDARIRTAEEQLQILLRQLRVTQLALSTIQQSKVYRLFGAVGGWKHIDRLLSDPPFPPSPPSPQAAPSA